MLHGWIVIHCALVTRLWATKAARVIRLASSCVDKKGPGWISSIGVRSAQPDLLKTKYIKNVENSTVRASGL